MPEDRLESTLSENRQLAAENARLREVLAAHNIDPSPPPPSPPVLVPASRCLPTAAELESVCHPESKVERVALFRSLFRGRDDVYAIRFRSRATGEWGYAPDGETDWGASSSITSTGRMKRPRNHFPLTGEVVYQHLAGKKTIGVYPMLQDETCWFLAADFDKDSWQEDALAFVRAARASGIHAYLERSRSGKGGHVWIFFESPISAVVARKLGCFILTQAMERRHRLPLTSYDRLFPNQDTMPKGGFGNLIALPLQWVPRQSRNSEFVDEGLTAYPNQWKLLGSVQRMAADQVDWIVVQAARQGTVLGVRVVEPDPDDPENEPWSLPPSKKVPEKPIEGPFPEQVEIVLGNMVFVPRAGLPEAMLNRLIRLAAFQNPEFYKAQAMRLNTWDKPRIIGCAEDLPAHIALPRNCLSEVQQVLRNHKIKVKVRDERIRGEPIKVEFQGELRDKQPQAVAAMLEHDTGILCAPTAFGKTVAAASMIARRGVNALVLVYRQQLLDQWRERLSVFLGLPLESIGEIGGGKSNLTGIVDVALIQSLHRKGEVKDLVAGYGHVIVDECHHLSAASFEKVMKQVKAKYVTGLTATPTRKDGHHPIKYMQCGPIRHRVDPKAAHKAAPFKHVGFARETSFNVQSANELTIQDLYSAMMADSPRNAMIVQDIAGAVRSGRSPLVLTHRTEHLETLAEALKDLCEVIILKGGMGRKQRQEASARLAELPSDKSRIIVATGSYIGEGFDDARLDTLFLTMPISWKGTLQQYVGRLHRLHHGKAVVRVYDYVDILIPVLTRMHGRRLKGYKAIGYEMGSIDTRQPDLM